MVDVINNPVLPDYKPVHPDLIRRSRRFLLRELCDSFVLFAVRYFTEEQTENAQRFNKA
jgi:hypothetical protein